MTRQSLPSSEHEREAHMRKSLAALALLLPPTLSAADPKPAEPALNGPRLRHKVTVSALAFAPDARTIASASEVGEIILWKVDDGSEVRRFDGPRGRVSALAFSPDGKTLVSGSGEGPITLWNVADGKRLRVLEGHDDWVMCVAFTPDGKTLASTAYDRTARLWDPTTGKLLHCLQGPAEGVSCAMFSPDGRQLATGDHQGVLRVWDVKSGRELLQVPHRRARTEVIGLAFCQGGRSIVTATPARGMSYFDATTGELQLRDGVDSTITAFTASADGKMVIAGSVEGMVSVIDGDTGTHLTEFKGYQGGFNPEAFKAKDGWPSAIRAVALSSTGDLAAAGNKDGQVRIWKLADVLVPGHKEVMVLKPKVVAELWEDLAKESGAAARAGFLLSAHPTHVVPFLKEKFKSPETPDRKKLLKLVDDLDDDLFDVREAAMKELAKTLPHSAAVLREALAKASSAEVKRRLDDLLAPLARATPAETLRHRRIVQVLERMRTREARALLQTLGQSPNLDLAEDAAGALRRLR
jgi:hypothetical protein